MITNSSHINKNIKDFRISANARKSAKSNNINVLANKMLTQKEDSQFLRTISLELMQAQGDLIKTAGVLDKILFWRKKRQDPELKQMSDSLEENTADLDNKAKQLIPAIRKVKYYQKNLDFTGAQTAIKDVEEIISAMHQNSREAEIAAKQVENRVVKRKNYTREDYSKDEIRSEMLQTAPDYVRELVNKSSKGESVPFSQTHMASYSIIDIKDAPYQRLMDAVRNAVFTRSLTIGRSQEDLNFQIEKHAGQFIQNFKEGIRQGTVQFYDIAAPSEQVKRRPVLQMRVIIDTPEILLPGDNEEQNIYIHPGQVWLTDMVERQYLSYMGSRSVIMTGYREPAVPNEENQQEEIMEPKGIAEPETVTAKKRSSKLTKFADEIMLKELRQEGQMFRIAKRAILKNKLPQTKTLISINNETPFEFRVRYAQILSKALRIELGAECSVHKKGDEIEVQAELSGSEGNVLKAVRGMISGISDIYEEATGIAIKTNVYSGIKSKYALIEPIEVEQAFRKFSMQIWSK